MPVTPTDLDEKAKVASIEPSVSLSDYGMAEESKAPLPVLDSTEVKKGEYGGFTTSFALTNDTDADLKSPRVGVVCYDAAEKIIGGTSTYPTSFRPERPFALTRTPRFRASPLPARRL